MIRVHVKGTADFKQVNAEVYKTAASIEAMNKTIGAGMMAHARASGIQAEAVSMSNMALTRHTQGLINNNLKLRESGELLKSTAMRNAILQRQNQLVSGGMVNLIDKNGQLISQYRVFSGKGGLLPTTAQKMALLGNVSRQAARGVVNLGKNMQWAGRQILVGFGVPLAIAAGAAVKWGLELDKQFVRVRKVYSTTAEAFGLSSDTIATELDNVERRVQHMATQIGASLGKTSAETTEVAANFAQMGFTIENGLELMTRETMRISTLGEIPVDMATDLVRSLRTAFDDIRESPTKLTQTLNELNAMENNTALSTNMLADALPRIAPLMNQIGVSAGQASAILAGMVESGIDASEAADALKFTMLRVLNPTKQATASFDKFGFSIEDIIRRNRGQIIPIMTELGNVLNEVGDDTEQVSEMFGNLVGKRQVARFIAAIKQMSEAGDGVENAYARANAVLGNTAANAATARREIEAFQQSASGQFDIQKTQFMNSLAALGREMLPAVNAFLRMGNSVMSFVSNLSDNQKKWVGFFLAGGAAVGVVTMAMGIFLNMLGTVAGAFAKILPTMGLFDKQSSMAKVSQNNLTIAIEQTTQSLIEQGVAAKTAARLTRQAAAETQVNAAMHTAAATQQRAAIKTSSTRFAASGAIAMGGIMAGQAIGGTSGQVVSNAILMTSLLPSVSPLLKKFSDRLNQSALAYKGAHAKQTKFVKGLKTASSRIPFVGKALAGMSAGAGLATVAIGGVTAVLAVGIAAFMRYRKNAEKTRESVLTLSEAADTLAESIGLELSVGPDSFNIATSASEDARENLRAFREENEEMLGVLDRLDDAAREDFVVGVLYDMTAKGATRSQLMDVLRMIQASGDYELGITGILRELKIADGADVIPVKVELALEEFMDGGRDAQALVKSMREFAEEFKVDPRGGIGAFEQFITRLQETGNSGAIDEATRQFSEFLHEVDGLEIDIRPIKAIAKEMGTPFDAASNGLMQLKEFAQDSLGTTFGAAEEWFINMDTAASDATRKLYISMQLLDAKIADTTNEAERRFLELERRRRVITFRVEYDTNIDNEERRLLNRAQAGIRAQMDEMEGRNKFVPEIPKAFNEAEGAVEDYTNELDDAADAQSKLNDAVSEFRSQMGKTVDLVGDLLEEGLEELYESRIDAIERERDALDERREAVEDESDARDDFIRKERKRRAILSGLVQSEIDLAFAIAEGDLQGAAQIREQLRADEFERRLDAAEEANEERAKAADEAFDIEEDALDARIKLIKEEEEEAEEALERRLRELKKQLPKNEAEWKQFTSNVFDIAEDFGVSINGIVTGFALETGESFAKGFKGIISEVKAILMEEAAWEDAGEYIGSLLGIHIARAIEGASSADAVPDPPSMNTNPNEQKNPGPGVRSTVGVYHSGGKVSPGRGGASGSPKAGEVDARLQTNEYVMSRKAVKKYGEDYMESLNNGAIPTYHTGGLVADDKFDFSNYSPFMRSILTWAAHERSHAAQTAVEQAVAPSAPTPAAQTPVPETTRPSGSYSDLQPPDYDGTWREANWKVGLKPHVISTVASVLAGIPGGQRINSAYRRNATTTSGRVSQHSVGEAVDIHALARREGGSAAQEAEGDAIARAFKQHPNVRSSQVLWKTMTGGNHYNHVHVGFKSVPQAREGAMVLQDNVLMNLHKGERVLAAPQTQALEKGIAKIESGAGGGNSTYNIHIDSMYGSSEYAKQLAKMVVTEVSKTNRRTGNA